MKGLYSIKDVVADEFGPIYEAVNDGVAIRNFSKILQEVTYPEDFELYKVGEFDVKTGEIMPCMYNVEKPKLEVLEGQV